MPEGAPTTRCCADCYFCRAPAGTLHCVRNPPELDRETGEARWPCVQPTDICGGFRRADGHPLESDLWPRRDLPLYTDAFGDYCKLPLTQGRFVKVDPEDYLWLAQFRWHCKVNKDAIYAVRMIREGGRWRHIYLHRLLMDTPAGLVCDHINHDGLDDRKANLRNCTIAQNNANRRRSRRGSSQYLGVSRDRRRNKWVAHIKIAGVEKNLGSYAVEEDAARAHDAAAWAQHGPFAHLNFPGDYPDHPAARRAGKPWSTAEDAGDRRGNRTEPTTDNRGLTTESQRPRCGRSSPPNPFSRQGLPSNDSGDAENAQKKGR